MTQQPINPYIEYYNLLLEPGTAPAQLSGFADGSVIVKILSKIKQFPVVKLESAPSTFAHLFSNMKEIYKKIQQFWNQSLDKQLECEQIDLVEIAHHQNPKQIAKILNLLIQTLVLSSERDFFVGKILQTSTLTQHYFMKIVEATLERRKTFSPRKQREQRLYDKMIELDHENQNLQNVIVEICRQKQEIQTLYKKAQDKITAKEMQIKKLNESLSVYTETPLKKKQDNIEDTQQKNGELVQKLKQKMLQMTKKHQKEVIGLRQQVQYLAPKAQLASHLQNELEMCKIKIQANNEAFQQYSDLSRKHAQMKLNLIEKQQMANEYSRKLNAKTTRLQQVQQKLVELQLQLQRKNVILEQMKEDRINKSSFSVEDNLSSINSLSLHRTLSQHCPEVANSQAEFLYESNKKLREELQRASTTIRDRQQQLEKLKKQYEKREIFETENKKLVTVIEQMTDQHDQEKSLILGCLHEVRLKTLNELAPRERAKRHEIKNSLKADNIKVLSRGNLKRTHA